MAEQAWPEQGRHGQPESQAQGRAQTTAQTQSEARVRPLAIGGVVFAMCMLAIIGAFHIIVGLSAILDRAFYVTLNNYTYQYGITGWGWLHLISGIVVVAAAFALMSGRLWARVVGIAVAGLSALENFFFAPYYPVWSMIMIALDVLVIWALVVYGRPMAQKFQSAAL